MNSDIKEIIKVSDSIIRIDSKDYETQYAIDVFNMEEIRKLSVNEKMYVYKLGNAYKVGEHTINGVNLSVRGKCKILYDLLINIRQINSGKLATTSIIIMSIVTLAYVLMKGANGIQRNMTYNNYICIVLFIAAFFSNMLLPYIILSLIMWSAFGIVIIYDMAALRS